MSNQMPHPKITTSISAKTKYVSPDGKNYLETNKLDMSFKGVDMSAAELKFALEGILDKLPDQFQSIGAQASAGLATGIRSGIAGIQAAAAAELKKRGH